MKKMRWMLLGVVCAVWQPAAAQNPAVTVAVTGDLVREHFRGVGFHGEMFLDQVTDEYFDQVLGKRWRELNPTFARVFHPWARDKAGVRDVAKLDALARQLVFMKEATNTEIYVTTSSLKETTDAGQRGDYARAVVDDLEYLLKKGATNVKYYCATNELSLRDWADMRNNLPVFRGYHQPIFDELKKRGLDIKLLATDASPVEYWNTLEWAAANMDDITGIYGGHHYANRRAPDDVEFYDWFKGRCSWAAALARSKGKDFILGEFGPAQYLESRWGVRWDTAELYGTPLEPLVGLQLADATLAAINSGVYAMGYWTFTDYPDFGPREGINQWGVFKSQANGAVTRAPYYSYGLLTKFFHGPASVHQVKTSNANVHAAAVRSEQDGTWSVAVINREPQSVSATVQLPANPGKPVRKYVYDSRSVPVTDDGDLQEPAGKLAFQGASFSDTIQPATLTVYTTAYDDEPPAPVSGLEVTRLRDAKQLRWRPNTEADLCYYRVFHNRTRIGSTTKPEFIDAGPTRNRPGDYRVVAVDRSGNASR